MKKARLVVVLLAYTIIGPALWLLTFIVTLPFVWKSVLSGKRLARQRVPFCVPPKPQPEPPRATYTGPSGRPDAPSPARTITTTAPVDIAAKIESGTMTPEDWQHVSWFHNREHIC